MKRNVLLYTIIILIMSVFKAEAVEMPHPDDDNGGRLYYTVDDSLFVCSILEDARKQPRTTDFTLFFAEKFIDKPYIAHTLEIFDNERLVVNTSELDCTTLVENVTALTMCAYRRLYAFRDYLNSLMSLRYRNGQLNGYASRLHYFSDWICDKENMGIVTEIQQPEPPFTAIQKLEINYMSTHQKSYKALADNPELITEIRNMEKALTGQTYRYIPKASVANTQLMRNTVKDGDIIAITCNKKGLDIAHLGFAVWREDGLHLLNASMLHKKVIEEPMTLQQYLQRHPSHTGIRVIRIIR